MPTLAAADAQKDYKTLLSGYLEIHAALAQDRTTGIPEAAAVLAATARKLAQADKSYPSEEYTKIATRAQLLQLVQPIEAIRKLFKPLSESVVLWAQKTKPANITANTCSMYPGTWIQKKGELLNPYYGKEMLHCGEAL